MFMNAQPRDVLHGFETFVPFLYNETHQRRGLCEMNNNEVNAWNGQRSVLQSQRSYKQKDRLCNPNTAEISVCILMKTRIKCRNKTDSFSRLLHMEVLVASNYLQTKFTVQPTITLGH